MTTNRYWRSLEERDAPKPPEPEFPEDDQHPVTLDRRSFLKAVGFSIGGALLSACGRGPANEVLSHLAQPEELVPGRSLWYAATCSGCATGCGALVKSRDGRPLKLEGNPQHPLSKGGLCAVGQASVLGLYDDHRLKGPLASGQPASWAEVDAQVMSRLSAGGAVRVLTRTTTSPTMAAALRRFLGRFSDSRLVVYDPLSCSALLDAHERAFGVRALPRLLLERAEVIASFDADFLGSWYAPVEHAAGYRAGRALEGKPARSSRHLQVEPRMSLTGANADERLALGPAQTSAALAHLARELARRSGLPAGSGALPACPVGAARLRRWADELWAARGKSLVVCGQNDLGAQLHAALANQALGNYGKTLDIARPSLQRQGDDRAVSALREELVAGKVAALIILDGNPVAELPGDWAAAVKKAPLSVSLSTHLDETSALASFVCPDRNPLEAWADGEPVAGLVITSQPTIEPLVDARPALETLSAWMGERKTALELIREHWRARIHRSGGSFDPFWTKAVHDGFAEVGGARFSPSWRAGALDGVALQAAPEGFQIALYAKTALLDGRFSNNPWLQELPDPVTKVSWDNYASFSPTAAGKLGLQAGDVVRLTAGATSLELPAHIQPGQDDGTVAVALGYGRQGTERFAAAGPQWLEGKTSVGADGRVGVNAAPLLGASSVAVAVTGERRALACTQDYHSLQMPAKLAAHPGETRDIVRETTLAEYRKDPGAGNPAQPEHKSVWPEHPYPGHRWGMAVDLGACNGCSACVISCQAENNIPVVGKDEIGRKRDMYWLRIDRYFADKGDSTDVVFQPMMCQQCSNAPCETVCPVLATMHSTEGLNQQIYNRCVGTRYCANNCPYKTRRFNWFQYQQEGRLSNLALNPDVTVRMRGVMEKCTFCIQRIQEAKFEAKREGRPVKDGDIQPACAQSCPAQAIVFGDLNDPKSRVSRLRGDARNYRVLAETNVEPAVGYLTKVRNRDGEGGGPHHG